MLQQLSLITIWDILKPPSGVPVAAISTCLITIWDILKHVFRWHGNVAVEKFNNNMGYIETTVPLGPVVFDIEFNNNMGYIETPHSNWIQTR